MASNIILLGPPGAGKGTQAELTVEKLDVPHIATGDILRTAVSEGTELGLKARKYMDAGDLVPDELVVQIVRDRLKQADCADGFVLDGFPRTIEQAEALDEALGELETTKPLVVNMQVDDEILVKRLSGRRMCDNCGAIFHISRDDVESGDTCPKPDCDGTIYQRSDDRPEAIRQRLAVYKEQTEPLIQYYNGKGQLVEVDASDSIERVNDTVMAALRDRGIG